MAETTLPPNVQRAILMEEIEHLGGIQSIMMLAIQNLQGRDDRSAEVSDNFNVERSLDAALHLLGETIVNLEASIKAFLPAQEVSHATHQ